MSLYWVRFDESYSSDELSRVKLDPARAFEHLSSSLVSLILLGSWTFLEIFFMDTSNLNKSYRLFNNQFAINRNKCEIINYDIKKI